MSIGKISRTSRRFCSELVSWHDFNKGSSKKVCVLLVSVFICKNLNLSCSVLFLILFYLDPIESIRSGHQILLARQFEAHWFVLCWHFAWVWVLIVYPRFHAWPRKNAIHIRRGSHTSHVFWDQPEPVYWNMLPWYRVGDSCVYIFWFIKLSIYIYT